MIQLSKAQTEKVDTARDWYEQTVNNPQVNAWREDAILSIGMYDGTGQWESGVKRLLEAQGRPALTINRILPIIAVISGTELKTRQEIKLYPRTGGAQDIAALGSSLVKHTFETCDGYDAISDAYRDGCVTGLGWMAIDKTNDNDPINGDLEVSPVNPLLVYADPRNTHYSADKGEFIFRERFVTKGELKAYYPDKYEDALDAMTDDWNEEWVREMSTDSDSGFITAMGNILNSHNYGENGDSDDRYRGAGEGMKGVIVRECWYTVTERVTIATMLGEDGQFSTTRIKDKQHKTQVENYIRRSSQADVEMHEVVAPTLNLLTMVGDCLLKDEEDPLNGMHRFPLTRFSPYWMHGHTFGVVSNLIDLQREHNKARSQRLHLANQSTNPGWKVGSLNGKAAEEKLRAFGATPGTVLNLSDYGGALERIRPEILSNAHTQLAADSSNDMREVSGANPDLTGTNDEASESGRARLLRIEAGQTTLACLTSNLQRSTRNLGDSTWDYIRLNNVYSVPEVLGVVDHDIVAKLGGPDAVVDGMNSWDIGRYGVKADQTPSTASFRAAQAEELRTLNGFIRESGLVLPPDASMEMVMELLRLSDIPGRDRIIDMLRGVTPQQVQPGGPGGGSALPTQRREAATTV